MLRALVVIAVMASPAWAVPQRVVSMNLCTDQLAMMLADPSQLISVSRLARDERSSAMADMARGYPANAGQAEEVFALQPDLVLAGTYSNPATIELLRRLGVRVETFAPAQSVDGIDTAIRAMGDALGQPARAEAVAKRFHDDLDRIRRDPTNGPRAATYGANGYSLGNQTLAGQAMTAAGLRNAASEAGLTFGGRLPLETLIMLQPDVLVAGSRYSGTSRSEEILTHPALRALIETGTIPAHVDDKDWICGTPHVINAIRALRDATE